MFFSNYLLIIFSLGNNDITANSEQISETQFHEQAHAAHYNKVGNSWYTSFVNAELSEMLTSQPPYGNGSNSNSPIIALGESWAYHTGHFMADMKYGANSAGAREQGIFYGNGPIFEGIFEVANTGLNAHLNLLEDFSPNRINDDFPWIPQGLFYDLMDTRNDATATPIRVNLVDNVFGYTNQQFFNALDADISSLPIYRSRLLNENGNNQAAGVTSIFNFYGY